MKKMTAKITMMRRMLGLMLPFGGEGKVNGCGSGGGGGGKAFMVRKCKDGFKVFLSWR